jgi:hypothetical protein
LGEHFIAALCADFEAHGARVIVREDEPSVYLRVIARVVPPSMLLQQHESVVSALSDEEVLAYLAALDEVIAARGAGACSAAVGG